MNEIKFKNTTRTINAVYKINKFAGLNNYYTKSLINILSLLYNEYNKISYMNHSCIRIYKQIIPSFIIYYKSIYPISMIELGRDVENINYIDVYLTDTLDSFDYIKFKESHPNKSNNDVYCSSTQYTNQKITIELLNDIMSNIEIYNLNHCYNYYFDKNFRSKLLNDIKINKKSISNNTKTLKDIKLYGDML